MGKKLLFITSRLLWPVDGGRKMSLNYYCKGLHEIYGYDVYLFSFLEKGQSFDGKLPDYIKEVRLADEIPASVKVQNILTKSLVGKKWPFQCSLFYSGQNAKAIREYADEISPDVIITEMIRTAPYLDCLKKRPSVCIANLDDLLSKRYRRQIKSNNSKANVAGAYAGKMPEWMNRIIENKAAKNWMLGLEADRCEVWEKKFYDEYDYSMFTSPIEANELNKQMKQKKALTLSVGIDYDLFARDIPGLEKIPNSLSYMGNFKVAANSDTLRMICEEILPLLKSDYKFYIIGSCPENIRNEYKGNDRIIFTGRIEDLAKNIRKTMIFLSPISYGTGIKTKIVEAMAMGMPVITNDVGAEGIAAENGKQYIVENDYKKIAEAVDALLADSNIQQKIGKEAQKFAYQYFRWEVIWKSFELAGL